MKSLYKSFSLLLTLILILSACTPQNSAPVSTEPPEQATESELVEEPITPQAPAPTDTAIPEPSATPIPSIPGWVSFQTEHTPIPRTGHAMVSLPDGRVLLFGGQDMEGNALNDTWIFEIDATSFHPALPLTSLITLPLPVLWSPVWADWNQIDTPNSPGPRFNHTLVTLNDGRIVLFGGMNDQGDLFNDLFAFQGMDWNALDPANDGPEPRYDHQSWSYNDQVYIQGGLSTNSQGNLETFQDLWRYVPDTNQWDRMADAPNFITPNAHPFIAGSKAVMLDAHAASSWNRDRSYLYDMLNNSWGTISMEGLPERQHYDYATVQVDETSGYMIGGYEYDPQADISRVVNEFWKVTWDEANLAAKWALEDFPPKEAAEVFAVFISASQNLFIFGGVTSLDEYLVLMWFYNR